MWHFSQSIIPRNLKHLISGALRPLQLFRDHLQPLRGSKLFVSRLQHAHNLEDALHGILPFAPDDLGPLLRRAAVHQLY
jgi:hypothetical protein